MNKNRKIDLFILKDKIFIITFEIKEIKNKADLLFKLELDSIKLFNKEKEFLTFKIDYNLFFKIEDLVNKDPQIEIAEIDNKGDIINNYTIKKISL